MLAGLRLAGSAALRAAAVAAFFVATGIVAADEPVSIAVPIGVELQATLGGKNSGPIRVIGTGADLAVRKLHVDSPGAGERRTFVVENKGPGKAFGIGIELGPPPGLCAGREPCRYLKPVETPDIVAGDCWEGECRPCPIAPSQTEARVRYECSADLDVGQQLEFEVDGRYYLEGEAGRCTTPQFELRAQASEADPAPDNNFVRLDTVPIATASAVYFLPADGAVAAEQAITTGHLGQRIRLGVDLAPGACPSQPVVVQLTFGDAEGQRDERARMVTARPVAGAEGRAVTTPFYLEELFWGRADGESIWNDGSSPKHLPSWYLLNHAVSPGPRLLPAAGGSLLASIGDRSSRLAIAADPGSVELWLEAPGPTGETRGNRAVRRGEQFRLLLRTDADSPLSAEHLLPVFLTTAHEDKEHSTLEILDRTAPGLFALELTANYLVGTTIEARHAYAPPAVDDRRRLEVILPTARLGLIPVSNLSLELEEVRPARQLRAFMTEEWDARVTGDVAVMVIAVERDRRIIAKAPLLLRRRPNFRSGSFVSEPFALGESPWAEAAVGDRVRIAIPDLDAAREYTIAEPLSLPVLQVIGADADTPAVRAFPGQALRLVVEDRGEATGDGPVDVALRVLEGERLKGEKVLRLDTVWAERRWARTVTIGAADFPADPRPGDRIEVVYPAGQARLRVPVAVIAPIPVLRSLTLHPVDVQGAIADASGVTVSGAVRALATFDVPPHDGDVVVSLRVLRGDVPVSELELHAAAVPGEPLRFQTEPVGLAAEPRMRELAAGDVLQARYGDEEWVSLPIVGRSGIVKSIDFLSADGKAHPLDNALPAVPPDEDSTLQVEFEAAPPESAIHLDLLAYPGADRADRADRVRRSLVTARRQGQTSRYVGSIDASVREALALRAGTRLLARYTTLEKQAMVGRPVLAAGRGRLEVTAINRMEQEFSVPVTITPGTFDPSQMRYGKPFTTEPSRPDFFAYAPATIDLEPGWYEVRFDFEHAYFRQIVEVKAGATQAVRGSEAPLGRLVVDVRAADGEAITPLAIAASLRRAPPDAPFNDQWTRSGWKMDAEVEGVGELWLPQGTYSVTVQMPRSLGGAFTKFPSVTIASGRTETLRISHGGQLTVIATAVDGRSLEHEFEIDAGQKLLSGTTGTPIDLPPGRYQLQYRGSLCCTRLAQDVEITEGNETLIRVKFGELLLRGAGIEKAGAQIFSGGWQNPLHLEELRVDLPPGDYTVYFPGPPKEIYRATVMPGRRTTVDRDELRGRLNLSVPEGNWRVSVQGLTDASGSSGESPPKIIDLGLSRTVNRSMEMPLPAGRYRFIAERRERNKIYHFADDFEIVAGQTTTRGPPALGELQVDLGSRPGFAWLVPSSGGTRLVGDTPETSWVFHVPEGNYLLGTADLPQVRPMSVRAGAPKSVTITREP